MILFTMILWELFLFDVGIFELWLFSGTSYEYKDSSSDHLWIFLKPSKIFTRISAPKGRYSGIEYTLVGWK